MKKLGAVFLTIMLILYCSAFAETSPPYTPEAPSNITLNLKEAPVITVIFALGKEAGFNIVASGSIKNKITLTLNDVPPYEALMAVLKTSGVPYTVEGNIIRLLGPATVKTGEGEISRENGLVTKSFVTNNISADDAKEIISKLDYRGTKILSTKGSNTVVVEAPSAIMQKIDRIIKTIDAAPNQVIVESQIMEVTAGNGTTPSTFGIKTKYTGSTYTAQTEGLADPAATGVPGFYAHVLKGNVDAYMQTLERKEGYNLLANPKVIAVSGKPAEIISGQKLGYKTTLTTQTGTIQNVDFLEVGTKLSFTPYISSDGSIRMDIHPEVSEGQVTTDGLPQKQTTEATTTVIVRDGETIIIGGLIKNKSNEVYTGVPVIMNIPVIGNFFKKKELTWEKKEIIAVLTPHLITTAKLKQMAGEIENLQKRQKDNRAGESPDLMWWVK